MLNVGIIIIHIITHIDDNKNNNIIILLHHQFLTAFSAITVRQYVRYIQHTYSSFSVKIKNKQLVQYLSNTGSLTNPSIAINTIRAT